MKKSFPLAPMSGLILGLTVVLLVIPVIMYFVGLWQVGAVLLALYTVVWLTMRPTRFDVDRIGVDLVFPLRTARVPARTIASATELTREAFKARFGTALRIGVGGLWGGFGWLWTSKEGLIDFYISRTDGFVLIERLGGRPLLLTPARPAEFVDSLTSK